MEILWETVSVVLFPGLFIGAIVGLGLGLLILVVIKSHQKEKMNNGVNTFT